MSQRKSRRLLSGTGIGAVLIGSVVAVAGSAVPAWAKEAVVRTAPSAQNGEPFTPVAAQQTAFNFVDGALVVAAYVAVMVIVRWMFVARPSRRWADAHIAGARTVIQIDAVDATIPKARAIAERCEELLVKATRALDNERSEHGAFGELRWIPRALFWNGARERVAWSLSHRAEQHAQLIIPDAALTSRLWSVAAKLSELSEADAVRWERRITDITAIKDDSERSEKSRYLLHELTGTLYNARDAKMAALAELQDKVFWMTIAACALSLILLAQGYSQLLLAGAVGGLLSRVLMAMNSTRQRADYGLSWSLLFAAPVAGAILAWGGLHILVLLKRLNILALNGITELELSTLTNPGGIVVGIALVLGTSARIFHRLVVGSESAFSRTAHEEEPKPATVRARPSLP